MEESYPSHASMGAFHASPARAPGRLKIFIGAAPGVGKSYTMLREAKTLRERGVDVVVGYMDDHHRSDTRAQMEGLEVIPLAKVAYQGRLFEEMNVPAIVDRRPGLVVIDELAHSNVPGSERAKRYEDVEYLLALGIDVMTAVNVQHLEHVRKEVEDKIGIRVREVIPQSFLKKAAEIQVIDVTPETLRQRLRDGSIYPPDKVERALSHFFRKTNLSLLREIALREVADDVDERLQNSVDRAKIPGPIGAKETIMVCVSYVDRSSKLLEKGARMAWRMNAELLLLTITDSDGASASPKETTRLQKFRQLADQYEAELVVEKREDRHTGEVILAVAERLNVTQIVIGQPRGMARWQIWRHNPVRFLMQRMRYVDLRIVGWKE